MKKITGAITIGIVVVVVLVLFSSWVSLSGKTAEATGVALQPASYPSAQPGEPSAEPADKPKVITGQAFTPDPTIEPAQKPSPEPMLKPTLTPAAPALAPVEDSSCRRSINFGETVQCSIVMAGGENTFTFTANAGDKVLVRMSTATGGVWPYITIYNSWGIEICKDRDPRLAEIASCSLSGPGTYKILANDSQGTNTGTYLLYLQRLNNPGAATPVAFGLVETGTNNSAAEMATYTFTAQAGDRLLAQVVQRYGPNWPGIRVYDPDGEKICTGKLSRNPEIDSCTLPGAGIYAIVSFDFYAKYTGSYSFYFQSLN